MESDIEFIVCLFEFNIKPSNLKLVYRNVQNRNQVQSVPLNQNENTI
jgi:hypothetical protein